MVKITGERNRSLRQPHDAAKAVQALEQLEAAPLRPPTKSTKRRPAVDFSRDPTERMRAASRPVDADALSDAILDSLDRDHRSGAPKSPPRNEVKQRPARRPAVDFSRDQTARMAEATKGRTAQELDDIISSRLATRQAKPIKRERQRSPSQLVTKLIRLAPLQAAKLAAFAARVGCSEAAVVRVLIDKYCHV